MAIQNSPLHQLDARRSNSVSSHRLGLDTQVVQAKTTSAGVGFWHPNSAQFSAAS